MSRLGVSANMNRQYVIRCNIPKDNFNLCTFAETSLEDILWEATVVKSHMWFSSVRTFQELGMPSRKDNMGRKWMWSPGGCHGKDFLGSDTHSKKCALFRSDSLGTERERETNRKTKLYEIKYYTRLALHFTLTYTPGDHVYFELCRKSCWRLQELFMPSSFPATTERCAQCGTPST